MSEIKVIKNYRNNTELRNSFNYLTRKIFGLGFEDWYQNGYWTDRYNPYSIVMDGKVVANVSVNHTDMHWNGSVKHFIQLGTVMTDEEYRNQGLIRIIIEEIEDDYKDKVDGIYLFANNSVVDFYPKFGLTVAKQFEYVKETHTKNEMTAKKVPMNEKAQWNKVEQLIKNGCKNSRFEMADNSELNMFYITQYMKDNIYYCENCDAYVVAEIEEGELIVHMVISDKEQDLHRIVECFGQEVHFVILGFTPKDTTGFIMREMDQDDRTLFVKGSGFDGFEADKLMFPSLAHA